MNRARHGATLLLAAGLVLALASSLVACGGAADGDPLPTEAPPTPPATPEPPTAPVEATAPDSSTSTAPATPAVPGEPPVPEASPPTNEPTSTATAASKPTAAPGKPPAPEASLPPDEPASTALAAAEPTAAPVEPPTGDPSAATDEAEVLPFLYDTYDLSGAVAEPGHYTFLEDPDDPSTVVTTYEGLRDGTATALLVHTHDAHGIPRAELYDAVEPGDLFEWKQADDCFVRYTVTGVRTGAADTQREFDVAWMTYAFTGCRGPIAAAPPRTLRFGDLPNLGGPA